MALTDLEIQTVKAHLGYGAITIGGLPYIENAPLFEDVIKSNVNAYGEARIRDLILPNIVEAETKIQEASARFGIKELVGDVVFDTDASRNQSAQLQSLRDFWIDELSTLVRVPRADRPGRNIVEVY